MCWKSTGTNIYLEFSDFVSAQPQLLQIDQRIQPTDRLHEPRKRIEGGLSDVLCSINAEIEPTRRRLEPSSNRRNSVSSVERKVHSTCIKSQTDKTKMGAADQERSVRSKPSMTEILLLTRYNSRSLRSELSPSSARIELKLKSNQLHSTQHKAHSDTFMRGRTTDRSECSIREIDERLQVLDL
jgi:hypothetical protein